MAKVIAKKDHTTNTVEDLESMLRRFKKQVMNDGILQDCKKHEYFLSKPLKRKLKSIEARKRIKARQAKNAKNRQKKEK